MGLQPLEFGLYILGDSFLRNYLSIYDFENKRAGLALHKYSRTRVEKYTGSNKWVIPLVLTVVFLLLAIITVVGYKVYKKR